MSIQYVTVGRFRFEVPESIEEAKDRRLQLNNDIREIQVQMSNRNMVDIDGERVEGEEYWQWRNRANLALAAKQSETGYLKQWIHEATVSQQGTQSQGLWAIAKELLDRVAILEAKVLALDPPAPRPRRKAVAK